MKKLLILIMSFAITTILYGCMNRDNDNHTPAPTLPPTEPPRTTTLPDGDVRDDAENMGENITDGVRDVGEGAGEVTKDAGEAVKDAADAAGNAMEDVTGNNDNNNNNR